MKTVVAMLVCLLALSLALLGCQRGDFKASLVIEGQSAPHEGWNIGPELWLEEGDPAKVTGGLIQVKGMSLNDLFGE